MHRLIYLPDELMARLEARSVRDGERIDDIVEQALLVHLQEWGSVSYAGVPGDYYEVFYQSAAALWDEFASLAEELGLSVEQALAEIAKGHDGSPLSGTAGFGRLEALSRFLGDEVPLRFRGQLTIYDYLSRAP